MKIDIHIVQLQAHPRPKYCNAYEIEIFVGNKFWFSEFDTNVRLYEQMNALC